MPFDQDVTVLFRCQFQSNPSVGLSLNPPDCPTVKYTKKFVYNSCFFMFSHFRLVIKGSMLCYMVKSHEMDSLLKLIFSNTNGLLICYSMYPQK